MKTLRLSVIATACALALTACSSGSKVSIPAPKKDQSQTESLKKAQDAERIAKEKQREAEAKQQELAQKVAQVEKEKKTAQEAYNKAEKANKQLLAEKQGEVDRLAKAQKEAEVAYKKLLAEKQSESDNLLKAQVEKAEKEKKASQDAYMKAKEEYNRLLTEKQAETDRLTKLQTEAEKERQRLLAEKQAETDRLTKLQAEAERLAKEQAEKEKAKKEELDERVKKNIVELKKDFAPVVTFKKNEDITMAYVNGKLLTIDQNQFTHNDVAKNEQRLDTLIIDGKEIDLFTRDEALKNLQRVEEINPIKDIDQEGFKGKVASLPKSAFNEGFEQMRYGYVTKDGKTTLFVQGHRTPTENSGSYRSPSSYVNYAKNDDNERGSSLDSLPTEQAYDYQGFAFYGKDNNYRQVNARGVADFSNKKILVELKEDEKTLLTLGATIKDSTFVGEHNGVYTSGAFYGSEGRDMGGIFYQTQGEDKDKNGVFGVTKQGCSYFSCDKSSENLKDFEVK
ncbi:hypothetical protein A4G19_03480 [Pasteurellaceae bacterium Macca]|nr:hypothetical protein [Pasteurellaceae bacterium Macca]